MAKVDGVNSVHPLQGLVQIYKAPGIKGERTTIFSLGKVHIVL